MFSGCSKLSEVKCLATDVSADGCVKDWLADAGKEAETPPVIEVTKEAQSALKESIPATFTTNIAVTKITLEPTALKLNIPMSLPKVWVWVALPIQVAKEVKV